MGIYHVTVRGKVYRVEAWGPRDALGVALDLYVQERRARAGKLRALVRRNDDHPVVLHILLTRAVDPKDKIEKWDFQWE